MMPHTPSSKTSTWQGGEVQHLNKQTTTMQTKKQVATTQGETNKNNNTRQKMSINNARRGANNSNTRQRTNINNTREGEVNTQCGTNSSNAR
jgi:hypothetical protein